MYDKMLLLRQRMSNGIISLLGIFLADGLNYKHPWELGCLR